MRSIAILLIVSFAGTIQSQEQFTLKQAQEFGLANNVNVKNASLDLEIAEKKVWETTAIGLPQVSGKVDFQNFIDIPTTVIPANTFNPLAPPNEVMEMKFGTDYNVNASLQVSQLVFSGNYLVGLQASKAFTNTSRILVEKTEIETKQNVAEAYYTVLVLQENAKILDSSVASIEKIYNDTKILVDEKVIEASNAAQLELSVLQVKNGLIRINSQIDVAKILLKVQMGMEISREIELTDNLDTFLNVSSEQDLNSSFNVAENIDHKVIESQLTLNELSLKNTKANYLPSLGAFFSHQQVAQRNEVNFFNKDYSWYPTTLWGLNLSVPIFSSGQKNSQVSQAKLNVIKTQNTMLQADQGLQLQMSQAKTVYKSALDIFESEKKSVEVAKLIYNNTAIKYKEGIASSLDLTQTQSQYLNAQSNYTNAAFEVLKAKLAIDKLTNKL